MYENDRLKWKIRQLKSKINSLETENSRLKKAYTRDGSIYIRRRRIESILRKTR